MKQEKIFKYILIIICVIAAIYFLIIENRITFTSITADEAIAKLENDSSIILLDVRTLEEYQEKRIPNSILIPIDNLRSRVLTEIEDKETRIFVYCGTGVRSKDAAGILVNLGYERVYNLGGIDEWKYETESGP